MSESVNKPVKTADSWVAPLEDAVRLARLGEPTASLHLLAGFTASGRTGLDPECDSLYRAALDALRAAAEPDARPQGWTTVATVEEFLGLLRCHRDSPERSVSLGLSTTIDGDVHGWARMHFTARAILYSGRESPAGEPGTAGRSPAVASLELRDFGSVAMTRRGDSHRSEVPSAGMLPVAERALSLARSMGKRFAPPGFAWSPQCLAGLKRMVRELKKESH